MFHDGGEAKRHLWGLAKHIVHFPVAAQLVPSAAADISACRSQRDGCH